ncbi:hypothetical protein AB6A40_007047 [Gnathostoma spinigerum]|uniref:AMP-dependent synthetase/ligase domain-containing protein n=1 Tax=Gnathostoma spinigerum TaxID=75299 RepID=A0ABD6ETG9_9BILA
MCFSSSKCTTMWKPIQQTIPGIVYESSKYDRIATIYDSENVTFTFEKIKNEMEKLAAGLLSTGLIPGDRILICGSNNANFHLTILACARAGLIFSMINPNFNSVQQLERALLKGEFRAVIGFPANKEAEMLNSLLNKIAPELRLSAKGNLRCKSVPKLTHVIMGAEDHKHAGTYTLSEIFGRSNAERISKLPSYQQWNPHQLAAIQYTSGASAEPKLVGLSHYQLINGGKAMTEAIGIGSEDSLCCALPMFKSPVFALVGLTPFISATRIIVPSPSPLPKFLFDSIAKYKCTHLLSNGVALRIILKIALTRNLELPTVTTLIMAGERVPLEVSKDIRQVFTGVKKIMNGYSLTEAASMPMICGDMKLITRSIGQAIPGFKVKA